MNDSIQIEAIGQINIPVRDLGKATQFYRDTLGLNFIFQVPNMMSFFDVNGVRLMLAIPTSDEFDHPASLLYYRVADIQAAHAALLAKGVAFTQNPHSVGQLGSVNVWMAFFQDPDDNHVAIMSEIPV